MTTKTKASVELKTCAVSKSFTSVRFYNTFRDNSKSLVVNSVCLAAKSEHWHWCIVRKSDPESETLPKVNQLVLPIGRSNHNAKFQRNRLITVAVIMVTEWQSEFNYWQTDRITSVLAEVITTTTISTLVK